MKLKEVVEGGTRFNKHAEKWKFSPTSHASQQLETGRPAVRQTSPLITKRHERGNTPLWACRDGGASGAGTRVYCAGITPDRDTDPYHHAWSAWACPRICAAPATIEIMRLDNSRSGIPSAYL